MAEPTETGKPSQLAEKQVPERDLLAVKSRADKLSQELSERDGEIGRLSTRIAELESGGEVDLAEARRHNYQERQAQLKTAKELADREKAIQGRERELQANQLAAEYDVPVEELLRLGTTDEMRIFALQESLKKAKTAVPATSSRYETGAPASTGKSVADMTEDEFQKHITTLRKQVTSKR